MTKATDDAVTAQLDEPEAPPIDEPIPTPVPAGAMQPLRMPRSYASAAAYSWRFVVIISALYLILRLLIVLRIVVLPVIVALLLASLLCKPFNALRRRGLRNGMAAGVVLLMAVLVMLGIATVLSRSVASEFGELSTKLQQGLVDIEHWLVEGPLGLSSDQIRSFAEQVRSSVGTNQERIVAGVVSGAHIVAEVAAGLLLSLFVLFFMLKDGERIWGALVGLFPRRRQALVDDAGRRSFATLSGYLRGVAITATVDAVLIGVTLAVLRVPLVIALAALTFFGAFIPLVGATMAGIVAALIALVARGPVIALAVVGAIILIQQIEGHVLAPVVLGRAVQLHPLAVAFALASGAVIGGIIGTLLAVPIVAVVATVSRTLRDHATQSAYDDEVTIGS
jgi:predicted PurR-regulated permease PerM